MDPNGLKNWGKVIGGGLTIGHGIVDIGLAGGVIYISLAETSTVVGALFAIDHMGIALMLGGSGGMEIYKGGKLFLEGWNEDEREVIDYQKTMPCH